MPLNQGYLHRRGVVREMAAKKQYDPPPITGSMGAGIFKI
jgi:hypothetical protein